MTIPVGGYADTTAAAADGLIQYLNFNEPSGASIDDLMGSGTQSLDCSVTGDSGDSSIVAGKFNNARDFGAQSQAIAVDQVNSDTTAHSDSSISFWIKANSTPSSYQDILDWNKISPYTSQAGAETRIRVANGGYLQFLSGNNVWSGDVLTDTNWHHVVITKEDGGAGTSTIEIYVDNVLGASDSSVSYSMYFMPWGDVEICNSSADVQLDDVGAWSRILGSTDRSRIYNSGTGIPLVLVPYEETVEEPGELSDTVIYTTPIAHETLSETLGSEDGIVNNEIVKESLDFSDIVVVSIPYSKLIIDTLSGTINNEIFSFSILREIVENLEASETTSIPQSGKVVTEAFLISQVDVINGLFNLIAEENITLEEIYQISFYLSLISSLSSADTVSQIKKLILILLGNIKSSEALIANQLADVILQEASNLSDSLLRFFELLATDTMNATHSQTIDTLLGNEIVDALNGSDTFTNSYGFSVIIEEDVQFVDSSNYIGVLNHILSEGLLSLNIETNINGGTYTGWVMNPETFSVWNYENYNFNSFSSSNGNIYAAATDGIYQIDSTTDDGDYIQSRLTTAALDFGSKNIKQVPYAHLGFTSDGSIILKIKTDNKADVWYEISPTQDYEHTKHIKIGKGLIGRNWQFELISKDNSLLDIESIEFYPVVFKRKR